MNDYDFSTLSCDEFENIVIDLISKDKNKQFERFKSGKDGGIDGRYYHFDGSKEIIQCKHYLKTSFSGLISSLKNKNDKGINEIAKVKTLSPSKYIFVTSLPLSAHNKKAIKDLFSPYIINENDIYSQADLNIILSKNTNIEEKYYKLWLSSTTVLKRIMYNSIKSRSEALVEEIKEKLKYYVMTNNHNIAIQMLEKINVIIIAGEPGIGKTTLAKQMAIFYIEKDFECYDIENSLNEAENVFEPDKKQLFYFDDFLGATYLEALENKKDSHLVKFIDKIKRDKTKRFILTSRTNIFNQSILLSDIFKSKNIDNDEFIISIDSLKEIDRAYILYNHIWHSNLEEQYIDEIYKDKRYKDIINHKNFSPRIIEFITDTIKIKKANLDSMGYWKYILNKLDNPKDIWTHTFDKGNNDYTRSIVILVVLNGNRIEESKLKNAYNSYIKIANLKNNSSSSKEFESIIEEVVKYFLNRTVNYNKEIEYTLFNPSIADFILNRYKNNLEVLIYSFTSLKTIESLKQLNSLKDKVILDEYFEKIVLRLFNNISVNTTDNIDYIIQLLNMQKFKTNEKAKSFFQNLINNPIKFKLIYEFVSLITNFEAEEFIFKDNNLISIMISNIPKYSYNEMDIEYIIKLIEHFDITGENIKDDIEYLINDYIEHELDSRIHNSIYDGDIEASNDQEGNIYFEEKNILIHIQDCYNDLITDTEYSFDVSAVDKDNILKQVDIDSLNEQLVDNFYSSVEEDSYDHKDVMTNRNNNIDALFER